MCTYQILPYFLQVCHARGDSHIYQDNNNTDTLNTDKVSAKDVQLGINVRCTVLHIRRIRSKVMVPASKASQSAPVK